MNHDDSEFRKALERDAARLNAAFRPIADELTKAAAITGQQLAAEIARLIKQAQLPTRPNAHMWQPDPCEPCGQDLGGRTATGRHIHWTSHSLLRRAWHHIKGWRR